MSDQNTKFNFIPKEQKILREHHTKDSFFLFLTSISLSIMCFGFGLTSILSKKNKETARSIQSVKEISDLSYQSIEINPFLVILKSKEGSQLTKLKIIFLADNISVLTEIQESQEQIKTHLIFILSDKNITALLNNKKRQILKQEIITQLNSFLIVGEIKKIKIKETFLN